jgi:hypothetical protein
MEFRFTLSLHRWIITAYGIFGVVFLLGILTLPYLFAGWLAPEEAKSRIHEYLLWQVSLQLLRSRTTMGGRFTVDDTANGFTLTACREEWCAEEVFDECRGEQECGPGLLQELFGR